MMPISTLVLDVEARNQVLDQILHRYHLRNMEYFVATLVIFQEIDLKHGLVLL